VKKYETLKLLYIRTQNEREVNKFTIKSVYFAVKYKNFPTHFDSLLLFIFSTKNWLFFYLKNQSAAVKTRTFPQKYFFMTLTL
jgi:outer membrane receptor for Fe3+-dicitrate